MADEPAGRLEVSQTNIKQMEEGARYEYTYKWIVKRGMPPRQVNVDVIGAKDLRIIDMVSKNGGMSGTFAVTTTKATDPAKYDLYLSGRLRTDEGEEVIVSRPIPFEVTNAK